VNGRPELIDELVDQGEQLKQCVRNELADLHDHAYFDYVIQDAVKAYGTAAGSRAGIIRDRLTNIINRLQT